MKLISLWEPWASLMACGVKKNETRSWPTNYRGWLAIHAAKRWTRDEQDFADVCQSVLGKDWRPALGSIVAVVRLETCCPTASYERLALRLTEQERAFGNYETGRWVWVTTDLFRLPEPVPFKGRQGLIDVPEDVLVVVRSQFRNQKVTQSVDGSLYVHWCQEHDKGDQRLG
jgi:activating signal cointegrator 1